MAIWGEAKSPTEVTDYPVSYARRLGGDKIVSSAWVRASGTVEVAGHSFDDTTATVWVQGGALGEKAVVTNTVTTEDGRTLQQSITFRVLAK